MNRSAVGTKLAKCLARSSCSAPSTLTQIRPLATRMSWERAARLTQTSMVGGESVTEQAALTVIPARPSGPSVVITLTAEDRFAIAVRNSRWVSSVMFVR